MDLAGLYRDIVETSPDGIWVFDLDGRTMYANPEIARMFGVEESEVQELTVFDSLDEPGRVQFAAHLQDLRRGNLNTHDVECQFVRRDGSTLWVLVRESALRGPNGEITGVLHRISDYGDRRDTLVSLRTSERRLAEAQRIARIGSWEWDVERDVITGSAELYALYGVRPEEFGGRYADFLARVHPEDRHLVDEAVQAALRGKDEFVFVARVEGESDWVWSRGRGVVVRDEAGRVIAMSGTHQDVTETRLTEMALQDSVAQNVLMQAVASAANEARSLEDVLGHAKSLVLLHDDWERARAFVPAANGHGVVPLYLFDEDRDEDAASPEIATVELELANRAFHERRSLWDGDRLTIATPISIGEDVCAVVTITSAPPLYRHDMIQSMVEQVAVQLGRVAERERAERELAAARDGAMEASRQKSEFLATMSHEIRTPLNGVIGLNDLLLRTRLDPDQLRLASGVQAASRALLSIINDVLDFSKIEAGMLELEQVDFALRPVFDQVAGVLAETARAKQLELSVSCHPDVPEVLTGDPTRLSQVLTNLGSNAVKFTEQGEVHIRATADRQDGRLLLRVEVTDTGVGVQDADVEALFDPFTQADASTTRLYGGTGLGLAISREIVEALGGTIGLRANPGGGTVFWFTAVFDAPDAAPDQDDEHAREVLTGRRVLVVDDNAHSRTVLQEQLSRWGLATSGAGGADEAVAELRRAVDAGEPFDGVLIDLAMPGRDGLDLARGLEGQPAYDGLVRLLMTTSTIPDSTCLREVGVVQCLPKPVASPPLRSALLRHLAGIAGRPPVPEPVADDAVTRHRVLVVEDNPVNRMVAVGLLQALGYAADTADDGLSALEVLAARGYDLVLMDVQMPRMDGYAATRAIRDGEGSGPRVPVVAMTAAAVEGERDRCLAAGMDDFLTKPVDTAALSAVLERWLDAAPSSGIPRATRENPARESEDVVERAPIEGLDESRLDELRDLDPDNTDYLDRAIGNFVNNTPGTLATIREACQAGDVATLKAVSHKLAGGALNLGVTPAGRIAQQIELVTDGGSTAGAAELVDRLDEALARGREALREYQATYSTGTPAT
jgi:PAS domain S-box-containing protein